MATTSLLRAISSPSDAASCSPNGGQDAPLLWPLDKHLLRHGRGLPAGGVELHRQLGDATVWPHLAEPRRCAIFELRRQEVQQVPHQVARAPHYVVPEVILALEHRA